MANDEKIQHSHNFVFQTRQIHTLFWVFALRLEKLHHRSQIPKLLNVTAKCAPPSCVRGDRACACAGGCR